MITVFVLDAILIFLVPNPGGLPHDYKSNPFGVYRTEQACMNSYYNEIEEIRKLHGAMHIRTIPDAPCKKALRNPSDVKFSKY